MAEPHVLAIRENLVRVATAGVPVRRNEIAHVLVGEQPLMAEVLRIRADVADLQLFEDGSGIRAGNPVRFTGELLSATLGPGLLGQVYDGLQNPLQRLHQNGGTFLARGVRAPALDRNRCFAFQPLVAQGASVRAGAAVGVVQEGQLAHPLLVPPDCAGGWRVEQIRPAGDVDGNGPVAVLAGPDGDRREVGLFTRWPIRRPMAAVMLERNEAERRFPHEPLLTGIRLIDSLFPVARGGTACIPGPFGAGKTMLLNLIARFADADVVVVVACGERAGEVVETIETFPDLPDPRAGGRLIDRTVIICNTSAMPVSARESSIHLGSTIGEYYRALGLNVLMLADSTSRWAQALRETSGFMEELPGDEGFPAYLDSAVKSLYERAGVIAAAGRVGSLTIIGTVSPAGGNFEEPVTQATLGTVKAFLGLSSARAYRRAYPAIDPLMSWSRYRAQLADWYAARLGPHWQARISRIMDVVAEGDHIAQLIAVAGEEGIALADFIRLQQAMLIDRCFLQQNALDPVDASTPLERQQAMVDLIIRLLDADLGALFGTPDGEGDGQGDGQGEGQGEGAGEPERERVRILFAALATDFANLNAAPAGSADYRRLEAAILARVAAPA